MKKKGDFKNEILRKIFNNLIKNIEYKNKVLFGPFIANMHYAGPREAIHHLNLREMIGFDRFTIGRDHAGAENIYKPLEAFNYVKKFSKKLKIDIFAHKGSYFCKSCDKIVLRTDCKHKNLQEISGSEFRKKDTIKKNFTYARRSTQKIYIYFKKQIILLMKILPTIGPETIKSKNLKYILNKTEIVRINSSHNTIAWHKSAIRKIKKIKPNSVIQLIFLV